MSANDQPYQPSELTVSFDEACRSARHKMRELATLIKILNVHSAFGEAPVPNRDPGEMHANLMLAYRHCEDAMMRLGKAIQAFDGGVSVYDK